MEGDVTWKAAVRLFSLRQHPNITYDPQLPIRSLQTSAAFESDRDAAFRIKLSRQDVTYNHQPAP